MPVPEGVDEDKYRRCIRDVKAETPAGRDPDEYAHRICNAQLAKEAYNEAVSDLTKILSRLFSLQKYMESDIEPEEEADIDKPDTASAGAVNPTHTDDEEEEVEKSDEFGTLLTVDILEKSDDGLTFGGCATVHVLDRQGELVDIEAFTPKVIKNFMQRTGGRIHLQHQDIPIAEITNITKRPSPRSGKKCLWVDAKAFNLDSIDTAVQAAIRNGDITGFSIKGKAIGKGTKCTPELCYAYVPNIELYGISAVERPANPESLIESKAEKRKASRSRPRPQILSPLEVLAKEWGV